MTVDTLVIGLTGPIGCGKSTVAGWLAERGAAVVDADEIARAVTAPGQPAHDAVLARFGDRVRAADGSLDRAALARTVFTDPSALTQLESIVHPAVRPVILAAIADARADGRAAVVVEAIKLVESGLARICDEVWLVICDPDVQRRRIVGRGGDPDDTDRRIAIQGDMATRLRPAVSRVVDTSGPAATTRDRIDEALAELGVLPRRGPRGGSGSGAAAR